MPLPNFLVIGAKKASSTLLFNTLGQHPDVWLPAEKEPHYFVSPDADEPAAWRRYLKAFARAPETARRVGEASTGYTTYPHNPGAPQLIRARLGRPKLIYILRDPVARIVSNYRHSYLRGFYTSGTTLAQALSTDPLIVDTSRYAMQLAQYYEVFEPANILVLLAEELHADPRKVLRRVEKHLELARFDGWQLVEDADGNERLPRVNAHEQMVTALKPHSVRRFHDIVKRVFSSATLKSPAIQRIETEPHPAIEPQHEDAALALLTDDLLELHGILGDQLWRWQCFERLCTGSEPRAPMSRAPTSGSPPAPTPGNERPLASSP